MRNILVSAVLSVPALLAAAPARPPAALDQARDAAGAGSNAGRSFDGAADPSRGMMLARSDRSCIPFPGRPDPDLDPRRPDTESAAQSKPAEPPRPARSKEERTQDAGTAGTLLGGVIGGAFGAMIGGPFWMVYFAVYVAALGGGAALLVADLLN